MEESEDFNVILKRTIEFIKTEMRKIKTPKEYVTWCKGNGYKINPEI